MLIYPCPIVTISIVVHLQWPMILTSMSTLRVPFSLRLYASLRASSFRTFSISFRARSTSLRSSSVTRYVEFTLYLRSSMLRFPRKPLS